MQTIVRSTIIKLEKKNNNGNDPLEKHKLISAFSIIEQRIQFTQAINTSAVETRRLN